MEKADTEDKFLPEVWPSTPCKAPHDKRESLPCSDRRVQAVGFSLASLESKISYSSISPFCVQKQKECLVKLESALFPPNLSQKYKLKIRAVGIFFSSNLSL